MNHKIAEVIIKKHDNKSLSSLGIVFSDETFLCGNCNYMLDINWDYCPYCGMKLDWKNNRSTL